MRTRHHHLRRVLGPGSVVAALLCATVLSACGSNGSDSSADAANAGSSSSTGTLEKVNIQRGLNAGWAPVIWADEHGYFKENGLDVTLSVSSSDTSKNIPILVSGQRDIIMSSVQPTAAARSQGLPVRIISGAQNATSKTKQDDGCLAPPGSSITDLADLEGASVGVPVLGHPLQISNNLAMRNANLDPSKVKYVALDVASMIDAGKNGTVDAICTFGSFYFQAVAEGFTVLNGGTVGETPNAAQIVWTSTDKYADAHPDVITKFQAAMEKAYTYLDSHPAAYVKVVLANSDQKKKDVVQDGVPDMSTSLSRTATESIIDELALDGFIDKKPSLDDLIDSTVPTL
ncbi:MAG: ABC transporter substrate-binding protein [Nocardioides sp.]|uniref:ABC transporter substrate-binding protein n=1 Tax=Nocardioides sp. TaxID=35761 RepID=UPI0039E38FE6